MNHVGRFLLGGLIGDTTKITVGRTEHFDFVFCRAVRDGSDDKGGKVSRGDAGFSYGQPLNQPCQLLGCQLHISQIKSVKLSVLITDVNGATRKVG